MENIEIIKDFINTGGKEIQIFKAEKQSEIYNYTKNKIFFTFGFLTGPGHQYACKIIYQG